VVPHEQARGKLEEDLVSMLGHYLGESKNYAWEKNAEKQYLISEYV
jgi:hypothetical protein